MLLLGCLTEFANDPSVKSKKINLNQKNISDAKFDKKSRIITFSSSAIIQLNLTWAHI